MKQLIFNVIVKLLNKTKENSDYLYSNFSNASILDLYVDSLKEEGVDPRITSLLGEEWTYQKFEDIGIITYLNPKKTDKWMVALHGYSSSKESSAISAWFMAEKGYNILAFDFINHGQSDEGMVSFGPNEYQNLLTALRFLHINYTPSEIGLIGFSMGAFTLNLSALINDLTFQSYNVKFGISDSPYFEIKEVLKTVLKFSTPLVYNQIKNLFADLIHEYKENFGIDILKYDVKNLIKENKKSFPILFFHSKKDLVTNYQDSMLFFEERKVLKQKDMIHIFETGAHIRSQTTHTDKYFELVDEFLKNLEE
ncbi:hypothetical protein SCHIN_v1c09010 [Spiroplasma chinense]|uniref:AB hydrolase-1 domain-containing protein n=1 Tax=Spiroplasma chinense TaxID=216932 RepID=A0A5B9Y5U5_9MOLU|nr:alpha/beta fold hydrolase [Spiroplasma chinense]QEH62096.1 hypothetical protein SCHIN_v1c09010 [Spiroplasma chinense]